MGSKLIYTGNVDYPEGIPEGYILKSPCGDSFSSCASSDFIGWEIVKKDEDLTIIKNNLKEQNKEALSRKEAITTSKGTLRLKTPVGDLIVVLIGLMLRQLPLYSKILRNIDGEYIEDLDNEGMSALYTETFYKYNEIDKRYKDIEKAIEEVKDVKKLNKIVVDYSDI